MPKIRVAVLASGRGTDFQSIIDGVERGEVNAEIVALITDNPNAKAIERAKKHKIPYFIISPKEFADRLDHDRAIRKKLDELRVDLVVLAGYMRIIKEKEFLHDYFGKIINIHPSLMPAFPGAHAQRDAFEYGAKVSGYTIHFVDESLDMGPVIYQEAVDISDCNTTDEVAAKILEREHIGLPKVVDMFSKGKFIIEGRRVKYVREEK
ncbi:MAG: phosphoribosylglycinamide formyltransferase [Candidatus Micrarchaeia archaeon]